MPGIPQTLEVPPPVSVQTILYAIYQAVSGGGGGGGGGDSSAITGEGKLWFTSVAPTGWLLCNGDVVSRSTYANLFAVIGTTFGHGDASTTFNLPDFRGRVPAGLQAGPGVFEPLGGTLGSIESNLTATNMVPLDVTTVSAMEGSVTYPIQSVNYGSAAGSPFQIIQPTIVVNFIIKT